MERAAGVEEEATLTTSTRRDPDRHLPAKPIDGPTLLVLGRDSSEDALAELRRYSPEAIAGALLELAPSARMEFLELAERVDEIVPLLPEAQFTSTVRSAGIEDNGWLVEFASPEQRIAAVDRDCWKDLRFSPSRLFEWIDAMIEAGPETLAASFDELDPEIWVLAMRSMADFAVPGLCEGDTGEGTTSDGMVFYDAYTAESEVRIREILGTALLYAPSHYWWLVSGAISGSRTESEEAAAHWQRSRLADLGFPEREQAMRAYEPLAVDETPALDPAPEAEPGAVARTASRLSAGLGGSLVGRALSELPADRASEVMNDILAVANTLAVADQLPLTEHETAERSLKKALRGIDRGLAEVARARNEPLGAVLDATPPLQLFRIGATLDEDLRPRRSLAELLEEQERDDWNVEMERISEADRTVGSDGRLR